MPELKNCHITQRATGHIILIEAKHFVVPPFPNTSGQPKNFYQMACSMVRAQWCMLNKMSSEHVM